MIEECSSEN